MARCGAGIWVPLVLALTLAGCVSPVKGLYPPASAEDTRVIWLVSNPCHAGLVLRVSDVPAGQLTATAGLPSGSCVEFGWGDAAFYQTATPGVWLALRAILWPTPSVLHVTQMSVPPDQYYAGADVFEIKVSTAGLQGLVRFVDDAFERDEAGRLQRLGAGLYGQSWFYRARGYYFMCCTCNSWAARGLRAAGLPVSPAFSCLAPCLRAQTPSMAARP